MASHWTCLANETVGDWGEPGHGFHLVDAIVSKRADRIKVRLVDRSGICYFPDMPASQCMSVQAFGYDLDGTLREAKGRAEEAKFDMPNVVLALSAAEGLAVDALLDLEERVQQVA